MEKKDEKENGQSEADLVAIHSQTAQIFNMINQSP